MKNSFLLGLSILCSNFACVSFQGDTKEVPKITEKTSTEDALQASLDFGGDILLKTKERLQLRSEWFLAADWLKNQFNKNMTTLSEHQLINAVNLYIACSDPKSPETFLILNRSDRKLALRLSWMMAASLRSPAMATVIESRLTELLQNNLLDLYVMPEMADAIQANRLKSSYTIL